MEDGFLPISWFEWVVSGILGGGILVLGALWSRIYRQQDQINAFKDTLLEQNRANATTIRMAIESFALQDERNDELRLRIVGERIDALKEGHTQLALELHRMEERIMLGLSERRQAIEGTMLQGFKQVTEELRKK